MIYAASHFSKSCRRLTKAAQQRATFVTTLAWMVIVPSALGVVISTLQNILVK